MVSIDAIRKAAGTLRGVANRTPLLSSRTFNTLTAATVLFKAENLQRIGAFKFRGAYHKIHSMTPAERERGIIAHSSGNHAQGVALAAQLHGARATIVMPGISMAAKVEATRGYGAEIVFSEDSTDDRARVTAALIEKHGYALVHPYDDETLIAGQGTVALEIYEELPDADYLIVPVGGGGLISGCAVAAKALNPKTKVIGVETEGANDAYQTFRRKEIVKLAKADTIADGMRTLSIGQSNFEIIMKHVDDIVTITDADILPMMRFFLERMKLLVEPTGAVAAAALMSGRIPVSGKKAVAMISGGNIGAADISRYLG